MKKIIDDDEEQEEDADDDIVINTLTIGELQIQSKRGLKNPVKLASSFLKDRTIRRYLDFYEKKKVLSIPSYVE